jgi:hypothetical protein
LKPELVFVVVDVLMRSSELMSFSGVFPISGKSPKTPKTLAFSGKIFRNNPKTPKTMDFKNSGKFSGKS